MKNSNLKYQVLTNQQLVIDGKTLYKIQALKDFNDVKKGDVGGYIEKEFNLSHDGNSWIYDNSCAYDDSRVFENGTLVTGAKIFNGTLVKDDNVVYGRPDKGYTLTIEG